MKKSKDPSRCLINSIQEQNDKKLYRKISANCYHMFCHCSRAENEDIKKNKKSLINYWRRIKVLYLEHYKSSQ